MQAISKWRQPEGTLGRLVREAIQRANALESRRDELMRAVASVDPAPSLSGVLRAPAVTLIAEVKRRSPSKGIIAEHLDAPAQAARYVSGGAAGISVLTEPVHFGGNDDDIGAVRRAVSVPVLKKDFHVAPVQIIQAKVLGASAALLIARALPPAHLIELSELARSIGLEVIVEIRDEEELATALLANAPMIGVNNRNLETLDIDLTTSDRLIPLIPAGVMAIAESGIRGRDDVERYARVGADAVLVGSSISAALDPAAATADLSGLKRQHRAR